MKRSIFTVALLASLLARPVSADPELRVEYLDGVPRVEIAGDYVHSRYRVLRADASQGSYSPITESEVLCTGPCYGDDHDAVPGRSYWYRFDLTLPEGALVSFGPYPVTISPTLAQRLLVRMTPNPTRGPGNVGIFLAGRPGTSVNADAALYDLQGRVVARIHQGPLPSGPSRLSWNGKRGDGGEVRPGIYLLKVVTSDGRSAATRVLLLR